jgi:hypothetical protein
MLGFAVVVAWMVFVPFWVNFVQGYWRRRGKRFGTGRTAKWLWLILLEGGGAVLIFCLVYIAVTE